KSRIARAGAHGWIDTGSCLTVGCRAVGGWRRLGSRLQPHPMSGRSDRRPGTTVGVPHKEENRMLRKSSLLVAAIALMLVAPQAHAHAAKGDVNLSVGGGVCIPVSDYKDVVKLGFLGGLDVDYFV